MTERKLNNMVRIEFHEEVTSTNDLAQKAPEWTLILADRQTKGRGQRGNSWESESGKNLTFSLVVCPDFLRAEKQFYLSKITTLALVQALEKFNITARIKWPNDIYVETRKIVGILIENDLVGDRIGKSILGIGINVNQKEFDSGAPNPTSVLLETRTTVDRMELLQEFCNRFLEWYRILSEEGFAKIDKKYMKNLYRTDGFHPYSDADGGFMAHIEDVLPGGELILKKEDGTVKSYLFKEVSYVHDFDKKTGE